jgi:hypothetical protein
LGGGFPFPIVLVPRYKLSLCHTPIKPDLLRFPRINVFACGLWPRDHEVRIINLLCRTLLSELVRYSPFLGSQRTENYFSKNNWLRGVILILLVHESIFVGWGFSFPVVLVPGYKLSLCHTLIKPDLLRFSGNWWFCVWVAWLCVQEVRIS